VQTERGELRRNRRHLMKTHENPPNRETTDMNWCTGTNIQNEQIQGGQEP
jgi:hypothetical protein